MQQTDRIRQVKLILVVVAIPITVVPFVVSRYFIRDLGNEERNKMGVRAEAMRTLNQTDENTDLNPVLKVLNRSHTIPVIVMDPTGDVQTYRNISLESRSRGDSTAYPKTLDSCQKATNHYVHISLNDYMKDGYIGVCYDDSLILKRLASCPYMQLDMALIFAVVVISTLLISKRAERDKVRAGLSKGIAHQLGTPIPSLMAQTEILKENHPDNALILETEQDVKRLQLVADRFSEIGSIPKLEPYSLCEVTWHMISYISRRTLQDIQIVTQLPEDADELMVRMNSPLLEWVIENLCRNAVDAMGGEHERIITRVQDAAGEVVVKVPDTRKGIRKKDIRNVFHPRFTAKRRGWELGLSLAKYIVEKYHRGKIWVNSPEVSEGAALRIGLKK